MALAVVLVAGGFVAITVAWIGVADTLSVPEQVSFALSGGIGGAGLVGSGLGLLDIQRRRYETAEERRDLAAFAAELNDLAELIAVRSAAPPTRRKRRT